MIVTVAPKIGSTFGWLTGGGARLRKPLAKQDRNHKAERVVPCRCACGTEKCVHLYRLGNGRPLSWGWLNLDVEHKGSLTHGDTCGGYLSPLYTRWMGIKARCECPSNS